MTPMGSSVETLQDNELKFFKDELASGATNTVKDEETREIYHSTAIYELHSAPESTQLLTKQGASIPETIRHLTGLT